MKALVGTFNQEKALVGAFSVIVQPVVEPMDRFTALNEDLRMNFTLAMFTVGVGCMGALYSSWIINPQVRTL